jgi:predicted transcriptional regulator
MAPEYRPVMAGTRITQELSDTIDSLAERLGTTRSDVMFRAIRNGVSELDVITRSAEHPAINLGLKFAAMLVGNPEEQREVKEQLDRITENRRLQNQPQLPGIAE